MSKEENKDKIQKLIQTAIPENMALGFDLIKSNKVKVDFKPHLKMYQLLCRLELMEKGLEDIMQILTAFGEVKQLLIENDSELELLATSAPFFTNVTQLCIKGSRLSEVPTWIGSLQNINWIILENNQFEHFGEWLGNLVALESLDIKNNAFRTLPSSIGNLDKLTAIDASNNKLENLPNELCNLVDLTHLAISNNPITELPNNIGNLVNLYYVNLENTELSNLPHSMWQLKKIHQLRIGGAPISEYYQTYMFDTLRSQSEIQELLDRVATKA